MDTRLQTPRLLLRPVRTSDTPELLFLRSDNDVNAYVNRDKPKDINDVLAFISKIVLQTKSNTSYYWCLTKNGDTKLIGTICLWNFSEDQKTAEVGYDLHPEHQGNGYMNEALKSVLKFGFKTVQLETIEAFTHYKNIPSKNVLLNLGFTINSNRQDAENPNNIILELQVSDFEKSLI